MGKDSVNVKLDKQLQHNFYIPCISTIFLNVCNFKYYTI